MQKSFLLLAASLLSYYANSSIHGTAALRGRVGPCVVLDSTKRVSLLPFFLNDSSTVHPRVIVNGVAIDDSISFFKSIIGSDALTIQFKPSRKRCRIDSLYRDGVLCVNTQPRIIMKKLQYCPYLSSGRIVTWIGKPTRSAYRQQLTILFPRIIVDDTVVLESKDENYFSLLMAKDYNRIVFVTKEEAEKNCYSNVPTGGIILVYH